MSRVKVTIEWEDDAGNVSSHTAESLKAPDAMAPSEYVGTALWECVSSTMPRPHAVLAAACDMTNGDVEICAEEEHLLESFLDAADAYTKFWRRFDENLAKSIA